MKRSRGMIPALYPYTSIQAAIQGACCALDIAEKHPTGRPATLVHTMLEAADHLLEGLAYPAARLRVATAGEPGPLAEDPGCPNSHCLATLQRFRDLRPAVEHGTPGAPELNEIYWLLVTRHGANLHAEIDQLHRELPGFFLLPPSPDVA